MAGRQARPIQPPNTFNNRRDTDNESRRIALNNAKDANRITRSQSPKSVTSVPELRNGFLTGRQMRQYEFNNQYGQPISIREDPPMRYPDDRTQPPHFNAGPSNGSLNQHYYFPEKQKTKITFI
ncbi:unnamed protein product [Rotaria sordida]|uniref:Uncharacterized protein n=1 Tax=Rotaria sordida TaxID=392033 RepID=A0A819TBE5_9BILA|nr:unnamed protein product [Rotaria sordida]CAF4074114.1 unnamed protein product [Rotaria sordida]